MSRAMVLAPGMSLAVTIVNSCQGMPGRNSMLLMRPLAAVERTVAPYSISGNERSSTLVSRPVTFSRPSLRGTEVPIRCESGTDVLETGDCRDLSGMGILAQPGGLGED